MMASVEERLAALPDMVPADLRSLWAKLTGGPPPRISPNLMRLALAWEIQASVYGGISRSTQQRLAQIARGKTTTRTAQTGMRLVREWGGHAHIVTVDEKGVIRWDNREWRSLSEVARAITGTRWSGPAFFGLKKKVAA